MQFEKYKKWAKVDTRFSLIKPTKQEILHSSRWSWPKFCTKKLSLIFLKTSLAKIMVDVQKSLNGGSVKADFLHGENIYSKFYRLFVTLSAPTDVKSVRCAFFSYFRELT